MHNIDDLFPTNKKETSTPKHRRKRQNSRRKQIASSRNARRHRPQRSFVTGHLNLKHRDKPHPLHRCDEKFQFKRKRDATSSADSYMDRVCMTFDPMAPYHCGHHSQWHIGHDTRFPREGRVAYHEKCVKRKRARQTGT